jgi:hypothetical protein
LCDISVTLFCIFLTVARDRFVEHYKFCKCAYIAYQRTENNSIGNSFSDSLVSRNYKVLSRVAVYVVLPEPDIGFQNYTLSFNEGLLRNLNNTYYLLTLLRFLLMRRDGIRILIQTLLLKIAGTGSIISINQYGSDTLVFTGCGR